MNKVLRELAAKGGKARARVLSPERRSEIARKAAQARWNNSSKKKKNTKKTKTELIRQPEEIHSKFDECELCGNFRYQHDGGCPGEY